MNIYSTFYYSELQLTVIPPLQSSSKTEREGVVITQFHYTQWSEHGHPTITGQIIEMVDILTRSQMNTGNKPITVVCK